MALKESMPHTAAPDTAWLDISDDWQPFLNGLWQLGDTFKVPGRKCKCKFLLFSLISSLIYTLLWKDKQKLEVHLSLFVKTKLYFKID
jgi:hypothetical protein